jgi:predicted flap endonuclease-1-like 5' DNA nuclease
VTWGKERFVKKLTEIEGIGAAFAAKLENAGISSVEDLLENGFSPDGRKAIAEKSGINEKQILRWINMSDLFRIKGVGEEYADLLEASGVDTVPELSRRNPENLQKKMEEVNGAKKLVRRVPNLSEVSNWIEQAKALPRRIEY